MGSAVSELTMTCKDGIRYVSTASPRARQTAYSSAVSYLEKDLLSCSHCQSVATLSATAEVLSVGVSGGERGAPSCVGPGIELDVCVCGTKNSL